MKCHYDVLEIAKDAPIEDLKKAYRKLALKWHPDKNPDNIDEAKREFILVQQAYEVLSDPQERAFYDRHRDSILKGAGSGYEDESFDVFPYFSVSCFRGYDDSDNGFYTIYREVFNKLSAEESDYLTENDSAPPDFGKSDSSYDIVSKFYGFWSSFCTKKSYTWLNTYDINEAENRRILRLMEQENKKVRERAKKERNEEIRALVAFVRKRDKRVQQYAEYLKQKTAENNKKAEAHRKKMIAEHHKNIASYKESDWSKFSNLEKELKEIESTVASEFNDKSDDSEDDDLFCVACNKYFKTEKSFANHEKSKKHKENVAVLKNSMIEEDDLVNGTDSDSDNVEEIDIEHEETAVLDTADTESVDELPSEEELPKKSNKSKKNKKKKNRKVSSEDDDPIDSAELASPVLESESVDELASEEEEEIPKKKNNSKSKKNKNKKQPQRVISEDDEPIDLAELGGSKKQRRKLEREKILSQKQNPPIPTVTEPVDQTTETTKSNKKKDRKKKKDQEMLPPEKHVVEKSSKTIKTSDANKDKNKLANGHNVQELDLNHECATCKESFDSKNKLFQHLTNSGHSILLPNKGKISKAKKKK